MTPEERQLITGLFDRMRGFTLTGKDGEAETLIKQQVGSLPDAPYMLVQSVLVQEHALQQADSRVRELEEQVRELEEEAQRRAAPAAAGAGSFLGGLFGSRAAPETDRQPERGVSVPAVGARATPSVYGERSGAWGAQQGGTQPPPGAFGAAPQAAPQATGGGFLQSAMATAAGVAGGVLAANAISSWMGSGHGNTGAANAGTATATPQQTPPAAADTAAAGGTTQASNNNHSTSETPPQDVHEAAHQDDGGWFGGDDGGGDFDI
jgi:hypothetical protein